MSKIFFTVLIALVWGQTAQSFAVSYCLSEDFVAFEIPIKDHPKKSVPWIVFHIDRNDPVRSSIEKILVPEFYCKECESLPNLLEVLCLPNHLRLSVGTPKLSKQLIYDVSNVRTKLVTKEVLKTFFKSDIKRFDSYNPLTIKLENGYSFKIEQQDLEVEVGKGRVRTERKIISTLMHKNSKALKTWNFWKESFEQTVD